MALRGFPYKTFATGWYQVGWSGQFAVGDVQPAKFFDQDLVIYRGESGKVVMLDAHCLHYGAHLGHGGTVEGDDIRCPFHAWKWSCDGKNVEVPYSKQRLAAKRIRSWRVIERSGLVLAWYDHNGALPDFEPPTVPEFDDPAYYPIYPSCATAGETSFPPQLQLENAVDFVHLKYVHRWAASEPEMESYEDRGRTFHVAAHGDLETSRGIARMRTEIDIQGVGLVYSHLTGLRDMGFVSGNTPIDHDRSLLMLSSAVMRKAGDTSDKPDSFAQAMHDAQVDEVLGGRKGGDMDIWEHMEYLPKPLLMKEEAPGMLALRNWCAKYYPDAPGNELDPTRGKATASVGT